MFEEWRPFQWNFVCVFPQRMGSARPCFRLSQHDLGEGPLGEGVGTVDTARVDVLVASAVPFILYSNYATMPMCVCILLANAFCKIPFM